MSKKDSYHPPYTLTTTILRLVAEISEVIGRLSGQEDTVKTLRLRRINQGAEYLIRRGNFSYR